MKILTSILIILLSSSLFANNINQKLDEHCQTNTLVTYELAQYKKNGLNFIYSGRINDLIKYSVTTTTPKNMDKSLDRLLAPHNLEAKKRSKNTWIISPQEINDGRYNTIIAGKINQHAFPTENDSLLVRLKELDEVISVKKDECFIFTGISPGEYTLTVNSSTVSPFQAIPLRKKKNVSKWIDIDLSQNANSKFSPLEETIVVASAYSLLNGNTGGLNLMGQEQVDSFPHIGNDVSRIFRHLPGATSGDFAPAIHLRGGAVDEVITTLDGVELLTPFHFNEFGGLISIIDSNMVNDVEVFSGGYSADHGGAMSGIVNMKTLTPGEDDFSNIGISFFSVYGLTSQRFNKGNTSFLGAAKRGYLDLAFDLIDDTNNATPRHMNIFTKLEHQLTDHSAITATAFISHDSFFDENNNPNDLERFSSDSKNDYVWFSLETEWSDKLSSKNTIIYNNFERDKYYSDIESFESTTITTLLDDYRKATTTKIDSSWQLALNDKHLLKWGAKIAWLQADYNYQLQTIRPFWSDNSPNFLPIERDITAQPSGRDESVFFSYRSRPIKKLTAELGLRWDRQTYTIDGDDSQLSPRFNLVYRIAKGSNIRLAWGKFYQQQTIHSLQVEDGNSEFFPAQEAEHIILGFDQLFFNRFQARIELYNKHYDELKPRYENLFDSFTFSQEAEPDRINVLATGAQARGIELSLSDTNDQGFSWWANYTYAKVEDKVNGQSVPRNWDQQHAANINLSWKYQSWDFNIVTHYRSAWPNSRIDLIEFEPELETPPDDPNQEFLFRQTPQRNNIRGDDYLRIDIRAAKRIDYSDKRRLLIYLEVANLLDNKNTCCYDPINGRVEGTTSGNRSFSPDTSNWLPLIPSFGIEYTF